MKQKDFLNKRKRKKLKVKKIQSIILKSVIIIPKFVQQNKFFVIFIVNTFQPTNSTTFCKYTIHVKKRNFLMEIGHKKWCLNETKISVRKEENERQNMSIREMKIKKGQLEE